MSYLKTERLELRPIVIQDAAAYWPLVSNPEILRYTGESPLATLEEVEELLIARPLRDYTRYGYGRLACIERSTRRLIGFCGLKYLEDLQETDVGYRFLPDCWGKGYATESAQAVMDHGRRVLGLERIVGLVEPENVASARILQKLGLAFESDITLPDHPHPLHLYATPGTRAAAASAAAH